MNNTFVKLAILISLISLFTVCNGQNTIVKHEPTTELNKLPVIWSPFAEDQQFTYCRIVRDDNYKKMIIAKISKTTNNIIWEKELLVDMSGLHDNTYYPFLQLVKDQYGFTIIDKSYRKDKKTYALEAQKLDENLQLEGDKIILHETKTEYIYRVNKVEEYILLNLDFAGDKYTYKDVSRQVILLDKNMQIVFSDTIEVTKYTTSWLEKSHLYANGDFSVVIKVPIYKPKAVKKTQNIIDYNYLAVSYINKEFRIREIEWDDKYKFRLSAEVKLDTLSNKIMISGQYNSKEKDKGSEGLYFVEFDLNKMERTKSEVLPFPTDLIGQLLNSDEFSGDLPKSLHLEKTIPQDDNSSILVFTQKYTSKGWSIQGQSSIVYNFNNIIVMKIGNSSTIEWTKIIKKSSKVESIYEYTEWNDEYAPTLGNPFERFLMPYFTYHNNTVYLLFNSFEPISEDLNVTDAYDMHCNPRATVTQNSLLIMIGIDTKDGKIIKKKNIAPTDEDWRCDISSIINAGANKLKVEYTTNGNSLNPKPKELVTIEIE